MIRNKWVCTAFTLWIAGVTVRYGYTVFKTLRSPFNPGKDVEWFVAWLVVAAAMIYTAAAIKRPERIVLSILAAACLVVLLLTGTLLSALIVASLCFVAHLCGKRMMHMLAVAADSVALTIPLGFIPMGLAGFVLAALHLLSPLSVWLLIGALLVVVARPLPRGEGGARSEAMRSGEGNQLLTRLPLLITAPLVLLNLTWAVAPEIQFDANNYHLAVSQIYIRNHGFVNLPYFFHSYFYRFAEMLFTIALAVQGAAAAKLLSF